MVQLLTVEGDQIGRLEIFEEADMAAALARFDELSRLTPRLDNVATRTWARAIDALNRRDVDGYLAGVTADGRLDDRRKGLRAVMEGSERLRAFRELFAVPGSWKLEVEPVAIRGSRFSLTREKSRDTDEVDRPITIELLTVIEVSDDGLVRDTVSFDPDAIDAASGELTSRWIASGEVAHPDVIEAVGDLFEATNRHDWDTFAALSAGATWVNHRQLSNQGVQTVADHMPSIRTMASLVPDYWVVLADVLAHSPISVVGDVALRGTSTDGLAIEIPLVILVVVDRDRVTGFEVFDPEQRDIALARFEELNQPT